MRAKRSAVFDRKYLLCWATKSTFLIGAEETDGVCCAYCGEYATVKEHLVPFSFLRARTSKGSFNDNFWTWILPSCEECNQIASKQVFPTALAKRNYIQERLSGRYANDLSGEEWPEGEVEELGPNLRQHVRACQARAYVTRCRVSYAGPLPPTIGSEQVEDAVALHYREIGDK
jgi:hypothetical protein